MSKWTEEAQGLMVEDQGPFAPEQLNQNATEPDVFSRRFVSADNIVDVYAAPVRCECPGCDEMDDSDPAKAWDVGIQTETRDVDDNDGNTSEYEYDMGVNILTLTYAEAVALARNYIESIDPERDFG